MRPRVHLTAESGWINDPHGLTFHDGVYHLFHQYVPGSAEWAPSVHWGHAVSTDLLTWRPRPVALAPGDGDVGVWTGCLVDDGPRTRVFYTSVTEPDLGLGRVRVATPVDETWDEWVKGEVVVRPPDGLDLHSFRDPFVVREGDHWRMLVGGGTRAGEALALTWTSADLETWSYDGVAAARSTHETDPVWTGALWECPQLVEVDGHHVLVVSVWDADMLHHTAYGIGSYDAGRFGADDWGRLGFGGSYYAPSFFRDRDGRPCLVFWMRGVQDREAGWSGCLSVPYLLSVDDGRLVTTVHPQVAAARGPESGATAALRSGAADLEWTPDRDGACLVLAAESGTSAGITAGDGAVTLQRPGQETWTMPWSGGPLRLVVDGPVLEVSSGQGLLGGAIEPAVSMPTVQGACSAWSL